MNTVQESHKNEMKVMQDRLHLEMEEKVKRLKAIHLVNNFIALWQFFQIYVLFCTRPKVDENISKWYSKHFNFPILTKIQVFSRSQVFEFLISVRRTNRDVGTGGQRGHGPHFFEN